MRYAITIQSSLARGAVEDRLAGLVAAGPFRVLDLGQEGRGVWTFTLQPCRPQLAVGFGNVAEFLVLLAREFDVDSVERASEEAQAAPS